ncbi:hypothetical protein OOT46_17425 [Aquabacterium sp. A7-Y]|uniref:hypothetical protein n=1 Tax=Aquabacterium sp. A7-Y TaxID=1349605 RepID=UPI00223E4A01|nr:hypothetical protein [Aquabacterium sp. A7-Y]MCW7539627.1 hypothetical protein [Aquabacterium sp. A7-Y]
MKALKSDRARQLLQDPDASGQLMTFLLSQRARPGAKKDAPVITVRPRDGQSFEVQPEVVPKAA